MNPWRTRVGFWDSLDRHRSPTTTSEIRDANWTIDNNVSIGCRESKRRDKNSIKRWLNDPKRGRLYYKIGENTWYISRYESIMPVWVLFSQAKRGSTAGWVNHSKRRKIKEINRKTRPIPKQKKRGTGNNFHYKEQEKGTGIWQFAIPQNFPKTRRVGNRTRDGRRRPKMYPASSFLFCDANLHLQIARPLLYWISTQYERLHEMWRCLFAHR